jgi:hypothetical protein
MVLFWIFTILGAVRMDALDFDFSTDVDRNVPAAMRCGVVNAGVDTGDCRASFLVLLWIS